MARAAQDNVWQAVVGIEPSPAWQCCGVSCFATQHNGLLGKVRPVAALKLRLVSTPLRPQALRPGGFTQPPLCLAPLALRAKPSAHAV